MKRIKYTIFILVLMSIFTGCIANIQPLKREIINTEEVFIKNYTLNVPKEVVVGMPMITIKNYFLNKYTSTVVKSSNDFKITQKIMGGEEVVTVSKDQIYPIIGEIELGGNSFYVVKINGKFVDYMLGTRPQDYGIFIDKNGQLNSKINMGYLEEDNYGNNGLYMREGQPEIVPQPQIFNLIGESIINKNSKYENFELVFGGTDGKSFFLTYREYNVEDIARVAFFQNLTYSIEQPQIRFKNLKIKIDKISNESLIYTVIEDGY